MTDYLDEIHRRADAAHPEPWVAQHGVTHDWDEARWVEDAEGQVIATLPPVSHLDAVFIAHARTDVPRLVAALRAVEALCAEARAGLSIPPIDCTGSCSDGPCDCSGVFRVRAWDLDPEAIRTAIRDSLDPT